MSIFTHFVFALSQKTGSSFCGFHSPLVKTADFLGTPLALQLVSLNTYKIADLSIQGRDAFLSMPEFD